VSRYSKQIQQARGRLNQIAFDRGEVLSRQKSHAALLENLELAQVLLQQTAQETQEELKIHIEDIVQLALDAVFPNQYVFKIVFAIRYGKTEAELVFISRKSGKDIEPMNASGGGVVDVCSFALRLAAWTLAGNTDKIIILDEPFRFVSRDLQDRVGTMMKSLSHRLGLQIIMTTHIPELIEMADKQFRVSQGKSGISRVVEV
jgi:DNA repair exonuclease SbcCD ATPase subunit